MVVLSLNDVAPAAQQHLRCVSPRGPAPLPPQSPPSVVVQRGLLQCTLGVEAVYNCGSQQHSHHSSPRPATLPARTARRRELLPSPSELLASPSELSASPTELLTPPSELVASECDARHTQACATRGVYRLGQHTGMSTVASRRSYMLQCVFPAPAVSSRATRATLRHDSRIESWSSRSSTQLDPS